MTKQNRRIDVNYQPVFCIYGKECVVLEYKNRGALEKLNKNQPPDLPLSTVPFNIYCSLHRAVK